MKLLHPYIKTTKKKYREFLYFTLVHQFLNFATIYHYSSPTMFFFLNHLRVGYIMIMIQMPKWVFLKAPITRQTYTNSGLYIIIVINQSPFQ